MTRINRLLQFEHFLPGVKPEEIEEMTFTKLHYIEPYNDGITPKLNGSIFNTYILLSTEEAVERWQKMKEVWEKLK